MLEDRRAPEEHYAVFDQVSDILEMFTAIEHAMSKLDDREKAAVVAEARHPYVFPGFDGNRESRQHGVATFLEEKLALWAKFRNRDLNSHHPWLGTYSLMWSTYQPMRTSGVLTSAQLIEILTARRMPETVREEGASLQH